ncbi:hypothetical protein ACMD2_14709, partial [Ananas comosus]
VGKDQQQICVYFGGLATVEDLQVQMIDQVPTSDDDEDVPNIVGTDESRHCDILRRIITEQL